MYNRSELSKAIKQAKTPKSQKKTKDIHVDIKGDGYKNPKNSNKPALKLYTDSIYNPTDKDLMLYPDNGMAPVFKSKGDMSTTFFPGANSVVEVVSKQSGGNTDPGNNALELHMFYDKDVFQDGGLTEQNKLKEKILKRYPGFKKALGTEGENLHIIADPNFKAGEHGYGNIEVMFPGTDKIEYTPEYSYTSPFPGEYVIPYNPNSSVNKGDIFLDMLHLLQNDKEVQPYYEMFKTAALDRRGDDLMWLWDEEKQNPDFLNALESSGEDAFRQFENNYIDGLLRSELARKGMGRRTTDKGYKLERRASSPEMRTAANYIYKYLKDKRDGGEYLELTDEEIKQYRDGGYIVEELPKAQKGITISDPKEYAFRKQMYDDSLTLHNQSVKDFNYLRSLKPGDPFTSESDQDFTDALRRLNYPDFERTGTITNDYWKRGKPYGIYKKPVQPIELKEYKPNLDTDLAAWLKTQKAPTSYADRKKLYEQATGKTDYKGTAEQNIGLLKLLKQEGLDYKMNDQEFPKSIELPQESQSIELPTKPVNPIKSDTIKAPSMRLEWFQTPTGTWYQDYIPDQVDYNINTGSYKKLGGLTKAQDGLSIKEQQRLIDEATLAELATFGPFKDRKGNPLNLEKLKLAAPGSYSGIKINPNNNELILPNGMVIPQGKYERIQKEGMHPYYYFQSEIDEQPVVIVDNPNFDKEYGKYYTQGNRMYPVYNPSLYSTRLQQWQAEDNQELEQERFGGLTQAQSGGQKDNWGRSLDDKWYGFDPQTKKYTIAPYKIQELRNQAAGVSKYDPLEQRALPSETTQQAAKNLPSQKKSVNEAMAIKTAEKDATIQAVKDLPLLTQEQKNEILMDPRKLDEYSYLTRLAQQPDTVKESIPYSARERAWDIVTNPFDAFEYAVRTGDVSNMPRNYNQMRMAGIDPSAGGGANAVGNMLNTFTNLFDAGDKVVRNVGEGNYGTAALEAMRFIPGARVNTGAGKYLTTRTPKKLPGSSVASSVDDAGTDVVQAGFDGNFITRPLTPFSKNELTAGKQWYRKIGNEAGLKDLINKQGAQAPGPMKMKSGIMLDAPFFGRGTAPAESYKGLYAVEVKPEAASKYHWRSRVAGVDNYGSVPFSNDRLLQNVPLEDLNVYRKKWFSNNYRKLDPENLQAGLNNAALQRNLENAYKWGIRGVTADQLFNDGQFTNQIINIRDRGQEKSKGGFTKAQDGGQYYTYSDSKGIYRKVGDKWEVDWNRSGNFQPLSKGDVKQREAALNKGAKQFFDQDYFALVDNKNQAFESAPAKPVAKKLTPEQRVAQKQFDQSFQVTDKSNYEQIENEAKKVIDQSKAFAKEKGLEFTKADEDRVVRDMFAYSGVYDPIRGSIERPVIDMPSDSSVSFGAPENPTFGDYAGRTWDMIRNPIDAFNYSVRTGDVSNMPWNYSAYEDAKSSTGYRDFTDDNIVGSALNVASYLHPAGAIMHGIADMVELPGRAYKNIQEGNWGDLAADIGTTALEFIPGIGLIDDLAQGARRLELNRLRNIPIPNRQPPIPGYITTDEQYQQYADYLASSANQLAPSPSELIIPTQNIPVTRIGNADGIMSAVNLQALQNQNIIPPPPSLEQISANTMVGSFNNIFGQPTVNLDYNFQNLGNTDMFTEIGDDLISRIFNRDDAEATLMRWGRAEGIDLGDINSDHSMAIGRATANQLGLPFPTEASSLSQYMDILTPNDMTTFVRAFTANLPSSFSPQQVNELRILNRASQTQSGTRMAIRNRSDIPKDIVLSRVGDKTREKISKMTDEEFSNSVLKPNGELETYVPALEIDKLQYSPEYNRMTLEDVELMPKEEYANEFNANIDKINEIIRKNNKSGVDYEVVELDPNGRLVFKTPERTVPRQLSDADKNLIEQSENGLKNAEAEYKYMLENNLFSSKNEADLFERGVEQHKAYHENLKNRLSIQVIPEGTKSWAVNINPGKWNGKVENIANKEYLDAIPGLSMSNTMSSVFNDGVARRGTGTYDALNEALKSIGLGRVKAGFNSQTSSSLGLWENAVKKEKATGYYGGNGVVYGVMYPDGGSTENLPLKKGGYVNNQITHFQEGGTVEYLTQDEIDKLRAGGAIVIEE